MNNTTKSDILDLDAIPQTKPTTAPDASLAYDATRFQQKNIITDTYAQYTKRLWFLDYSDSMNGAVCGRSGRDKIGLLKRLVTMNLDEKIARWGENILIKIYQFHGHVEEFTGSSLGAIRDRIENTFANGWNTVITAAIDAGVVECEQNPSPVGTHQIMMVTDGLDPQAEGIDQVYGERCKAANIVVDVLYIKDAWGGEAAVMESLKRLCEMTGGRFVIADSEESVRREFIASADRLCLPPATGKLAGGV